MSNQQFALCCLSSEKKQKNLVFHSMCYSNKTISRFGFCDSLSLPLQLIFQMSQKPHPIIVQNLTGLFNCNRQKNCIFLLESVLPNLVASSLLVRIEFSSIICTPISVTMMKHQAAISIFHNSAIITLHQVIIVRYNTINPQPSKDALLYNHQGNFTYNDQVRASLKTSTL